MSVNDASKMPTVYRLKEQLTDIVTANVQHTDGTIEKGDDPDIINSIAFNLLNLQTLQFALIPSEISSPTFPIYEALRDDPGKSFDIASSPFVSIGSLNDSALASSGKSAWASIEALAESPVKEYESFEFELEEFSAYFEGVEVLIKTMDGLLTAFDPIKKKAVKKISPVQFSRIVNVITPSNRASLFYLTEKKSLVSKKTGIQQIEFQFPSATKSKQFASYVVNILSAGRVEEVVEKKAVLLLESGDVSTCM
jgi:hypothetical protein